MDNSALENIFVENACLSFRMTCLHLLEMAYCEVLGANTVTRDWDENAISEALVNCLNNNDTTISLHITAIVEKRMLKGGLNSFSPTVDNAPRIDIMIGGFGWCQPEYRVQLYMEAKNLYCRYFKKEGRSSYTSSTYYVQRYITTGIDNLLTRYYPGDTLLLGYVLDGSVQVAVDKINQALTKLSRSTESIAIQQCAEFPCLTMGVSTHPNGDTIGHCYLLFQ